MAYLVPASSPDRHARPYLMNPGEQTPLELRLMHPLGRALRTAAPDLLGSGEILMQISCRHDGPIWTLRLVIASVDISSRHAQFSPISLHSTASLAAESPCLERCR